MVTIPVVVNVVYKTSAQNISDAQIQSQLDVLNADFRRTNADADNTWSQAADTEIEFCLASVDPDGNPTDGIRRKSTNKPSWQANDAMKGNQGLTPWDPSSYLNIWVCNLSGGLLGYAQFPGAIRRRMAWSAIMRISVRLAPPRFPLMRGGPVPTRSATISTCATSGGMVVAASTTSCPTRRPRTAPTTAVHSAT